MTGAWNGSTVKEHTHTHTHTHTQKKKEGKNNGCATGDAALSEIYFFKRADVRSARRETSGQRTGRPNFAQLPAMNRTIAECG